MEVFFHHRFKKRYRKIPADEQKKCDQRIELFMREPFHRLLNNHTLTASIMDIGVSTSPVIFGRFMSLFRRTVFFYLGGFACGAVWVEGLYIFPRSFTAPPG